MLIVRGVIIYPSQVEEVLFGFEGVTPHYMLRITRDGALDNMEIQVEVTESMFFDEMKKQRDLVDKITDNLRNALGISVKVKMVEPRSLERFQEKAKRVVDERDV